MKTNREIYAARYALAKIANADLPLPLIIGIAPTLAECEGVIEKAMRIAEQGGEELERYLGGVRELPTCVMPVMPEIRMSYIEFKSLEGIISFEGGKQCQKS